MENDGTSFRWAQNSVSLGHPFVCSCLYPHAAPTCVTGHDFSADVPAYGEDEGRLGREEAERRCGERKNKDALCGKEGSSAFAERLGLTASDFFFFIKFVI